jgi:putative transposase
MRKKSRRKRYPSNLSDGAWNAIRHLLPDCPVGRPRTLSLRQVLNAIFCIVKTGCQWRQLPREFPPWNAVYYEFRRRRRDGTLVCIHETLRAAPGTGASQTLERRLLGQPECEGNRYAGCARLRCRQEDQWTQAPHSRRYLGTGADGGGQRSECPGSRRRTSPPALLARVLQEAAHHLGRWRLRRTFAAVGGRAFSLPLVLRPKETRRFVLLPRRLSKDYDRLMSSSETWIYLAMISLMANRLA